MHVSSQRKTTADGWSRALGLLPVPMKHNGDRSRFVLLNGTRGNFCADFSNEKKLASGRADAWSVNVGHYVTVSPSKVRVQRWDSPDSDETYSRTSVENNLEKFHVYLQSSEPASDSSVVSHAIRVFRQLRNGVPDADGYYALSGFLALLSDALGKVGSAFPEIDSRQINGDIKNSISSPDWECLLDELLRGRRTEKLVLDPRLLLRHAAGYLFQEAHYEATLVNPGQLKFSGFGLQQAQVTAHSKGSGVHFTPPALARTLVEHSIARIDLSKDELRILDPACGSGEFLREALRQLRIRGYRNRVVLIGRDISRAACVMAKYLLDYERLVDACEVIIDVKESDSLTETWASSPDLLLMNPPFVSYEDMSADQKLQTHSVLAGLSRGRVDMSLAFIWKAVESISASAVIGAIIPASFLESEAASKIRKAVEERLSLGMVSRLGSQSLFPNAIVDAAMIILNPKGKADSTVAFWSDHRSRSSSSGLRELRRWLWSHSKNALPIIRDGFSIYEADDLQNMSSWSPRPYASWKLLHSLQTHPTAGELFDVKSGARTGDIRTFLIEKDDWCGFTKSEQQFFRPAIVNESVVDGRLYDSKYVFFPYGKFRIESERELAKAVPRFYEAVLKKNKQKLVAGAVTAGVKKWWEHRRSRSFQHTNLPKLVSVYFGDAGSFAWDEKGDYVVVSGFAWLPRPNFMRVPSLPRRYALAYLALLNSPTMSDLLSATSRNVQGGQWDLSKRYVSLIRIPDLSQALHSTILPALSELGEAIHNGSQYSSEYLNEVVQTAYGNEAS